MIWDDQYVFLRHWDMYVAALYDFSHLKLFILLDEFRWKVFYQSETEYYFIMVDFGRLFSPT